VTSAVRLALAWLFRAPARSLMRVLVLAASTALLGGMLLFVGNSLRTVSGSAVRSVPLDLQGPVASYAEARAVAAQAARQPAVQQASAAATAPLLSSEHRAANGLTSSGAGAVLAVPVGYDAHVHTFRLLRGSLIPGAIVLDQQMAATLQAKIGDRVTLRARSGLAHTYRVSGVALVTAPDQLFQPLNPQLGPVPAQPPANIAIMPVDTFAATYARGLPAVAAASTGAGAQPGSQAGVQWQVQVQLDPAALSGGSPSSALTRATRTRNLIERTLPGRVQFVDNLSESLEKASEDALYAETLYIMLAVPGALIALGLAYLAALGTADRDRRDLALLRARGARRRDLIALAAVESAMLGIAGAVVGTAGAFAAVSALVNGGAHATAGRVLIVGAICILLATAGAAAARFGASLSAFRASIASARRGTGRATPPLWQRLYLDVASLIVSALIYWLTASTGFSAVVNPDSNPTLSLSVYMFFAPALLWLGATLLLVRLRGRALSWLIGHTVSRGRAVSRSGFLLVSAGRRGAAINRGLIVVGLLLAFGVNLGIFAATYDQQVKVDAQLTLGADVTATAPPGVAARRDLAGRIAAVPGVSGTTGVEHSYAYVGPDLQDTYGIDAASFGRVTSLRDSYFLGASARQALSRLRARPDAILVSKETISDFSLRNGDLLRLRVLDQRNGRFHVVPFHVAAIVQEFPSAPKDSFMVTNLAYLESVTHAGGPNVVFAKVSGYPPDVAHRVAAATSTLGTKVENITSQTARTGSAVTTVDLAGISHIEQAFAIVLAAAAMALFVALGISERRREFATMAAIGASLSRVSAFVWTEAALVLGVGLVLALGLGVLLSAMLVAMLQHVFDPPPDALAIPWGFLAGLAGASVAATLVATAAAARGIRRLPLGEILREQ
jgi:putative ABC transport system permease protein